MNNRSVALILLLAIAVVTFFWYSQTNNYSRFKWNETYDIESTEPFGLKAFTTILQQSYPGKVEVTNKPVSEVLPDHDTTEKATYVFVGSNIFLQSSDLDDLLAFAEDGNIVFLASKVISSELVYSLFDEECASSDACNVYQDSIVTFNLVHNDLKTNPDFKVTLLRKQKHFIMNWHFLDSGAYFCDTDYSWSKIGYMNDGRVNFIRIPYGEGIVYLYTTPQVFTNYCLNEPGAEDYISGLLSHFQGDKIYFDNFSRIPFMSDNGINQQGPLSYILSQEMLRWAWYVILVTALLFVIVFSRRRQRIIPVIEPDVNTSMQFLKVISSMYYDDANHREAARQRMKYFLLFIRNKFGLPTHVFNQDFIETLSRKSKVAPELIESIIYQYDIIQKYQDITSDRLHTFSSSIDQFYQLCNK